MKENMMLRLILPKFLVVVLFLIVIFGEALAATYYVSPAGRDSNNGAINIPFKTIQKAANAVNPGDTVYVRAGTYNERVTLTTSGTAGNYITFQNYPAETVILDVGNTGVSDRLMFGGTHLNYIKVIGFTIRNFKGAGIYFMGQCNHIEIRNNEIYNGNVNSGGTKGTFGMAIKVTGRVGNQYYPVSDIIIDNNYIHDYVTGANGAGETLNLAYDVQRFQIKNNTLENCVHIGISVIGKKYAITTPHALIDDYPQYGIISGNTVRGTGTKSYDSSIYIDYAKNLTIENNVVADSRGPGITVSSEEEGTKTENIIVRRNKVYNNSKQMYFGASSVAGGKTINSRYVHNTAVQSASGKDKVVYLGFGTGNIVKNNIFYRSNGSYMLRGATGMDAITLDYNDFYETSNTNYHWNGTYYLGFSAYQTASGPDAHSISSNPKFTNLGAFDLTLQKDSPAVDAGDYLARTTSAESGTVITVSDARYFHDGYGISGVSGDVIRVGSNTVTVTDVDYRTNTMTVDRSITWNKGDGVSYPYSGSRPDMGAYEYIGPSTKTSSTTTSKTTTLPSSSDVR